MIERAKHRIQTTLGTVGLVAALVGLSGCINIGTDFDGVPLDEVESGGAAPVEVSMFGPDDLVLTVGKTFSITVEGDDDVLESLRFKRDDDSISVGRDSDWDGPDGKAIIRITMPAPHSISLAGSGNIEAAVIAKEAEVSLAGSGDISIAEIAADDLDVSIAGSGSLSGSGTASELEVAIAGSGNVRFANLKADKVDISIAGSGGVTLASDGEVEASLAGSGDAIVTGSAKCSSSTVGSGSLKCKPASENTDEAVIEEASETIVAKDEDNTPQ